MDTIKLLLDPDREYGIVLEGGGAKGAYQIGAWRALREAGVKIRGAAGTSVGALNGALICMDDFGRAERIWENISYSRVMDVDDDLMDRLRKFSIKNLSGLNVPALISGVRRILKDGGFDIAPLRKLIEDVVDEEKIRSSHRELYVVTYSISDRHPLIADVREAPEGEMADLLMASAYLIGFRQERLGGKYYMDGSGINNVPVDVLLDRGYKDVIVLRIYGYGKDTERKLEVPEGANIYHVAPRQDLGGILEFDRRRARRNMLLGYFDGKRMLYGLAGRVYYIDAPEGETYYFDKMMSEIEQLLSWMEPERGWTKPEDRGEGTAGGTRAGGIQAGEARAGETRAGGTRAGGTQAGEARAGGIRAASRQAGADQKDVPGYRAYTEQIFPRLARELRLKEGWDYKDLYLSILEDLAKQYRISRFRIYTVEALLGLIHKKAGEAFRGVCSSKARAAGPAVYSSKTDQPL